LSSTSTSAMLPDTFGATGAMCASTCASSVETRPS
jgi:hypothetical protein